MKSLHASSDRKVPNKPPEQNGTRPNPFGDGDGDGSSCKRRRTFSSGLPLASAASMESSEVSPIVESSGTRNAGDRKIRKIVEQTDLLPEQDWALAGSSKTSQPWHPPPVMPHGNHHSGPAVHARHRHKPSLEEVFQQFPVYLDHPVPLTLDVLTVLRQSLTDHCAVRGISEWLRTFLNTANSSLRESGHVPNYDQRQILIALGHLYQDLSKNQTPPASWELEAGLKDLLSLMADLTVYLLLLDRHTVDLWRTGNDFPNDEGIPLLLSIPYLNVFHKLVVRDRDPELGPLSPSWEPGDQSSDLLARFGRLQGGGDELLRGLALDIAQIVEVFPRTADDISAITPVLAERLGFICRLMRSSGQRDLLFLKQELCAGHELWQSLSSCVLVVASTEEQDTPLSIEGTSQAIRGLDDMLQCCLEGDHYEAEHAKMEHRQSHPSIDPRLTGEALAWEWKLQLWSELIRGVPSRLRQMAAGNLGVALLQLFNRSSTTPVQRDPTFLRHIGTCLVGHGLMDYILNPSCHPEVTIQCGNIVGFMLATKQFSQEDRRHLWQSVSDAQNLRFAEALTLAIKPYLNLFDNAGLSDICENFLNLPLGAMTPPLRGLWAALHEFLCTKSRVTQTPIDRFHFTVCLRMLREAYAPTSGSQDTDLEMRRHADQQLSDLFAHGLDVETCQHVLQDCIRDLAARSPTTLGSLWCLHRAMQSEVAAGMMGDLVLQHDMARLLKEELEHAVRLGQKASAPAVISGDVNLPRRHLVSMLMRSHPEAITNELGANLWDHLVGELSPCPEDRQAGWQMILDIASKDKEFRNPYLNMCTSRHLSRLPPSCFCKGMLKMVHRQVPGLVDNGKDEEKHHAPQSDGPDAPGATDDDSNTNEGNTQNEGALDDEALVKDSVIKNLWRIILEADDTSLSEEAIDILARGVYLESPLMSSYSEPGAQAVHASLIDKCLQQVVSAADQLRANTTGVKRSKDNPTPTPTMDQEILMQGRIFDRIIQFLHRFVEAHHSSERFSQPDLRSHASRKKFPIQGRPARITYQCVTNQGTASPVRPLEIGVLNTGRSLLLKLRLASGFDTCSFYLNGDPLLLSMAQMRQSLRDLHLEEGLIVVQQNPEGSTLVRQIRPEPSFIENKILSHFHKLWRYMHADDQIAEKVYHLLKDLPAHWCFKDIFDNLDLRYSHFIFPGKPLQSLYAIYALADYLKAIRLAEPRYLVDFASRTISCEVEQAISSWNLMPGIRIRLQEDVLKSLIKFLVQILTKETHRYISIRADLPEPLKLMSLMSVALDKPGEKGILLLTNTLAILLRLAMDNKNFREQLINDPQFRALLGRLVLYDERVAVRSNAMILLSFAMSLDIKGQVDAVSRRGFEPELSPASLTACVWTAMLSFLDRSVDFPRQCSEFFRLLEGLLCCIATRFQMDVQDYRALANKATDLLLHHRSTEEIDDKESIDNVAGGLISIELVCTKIAKDHHLHNEPDPKIAETLFWRFLFPRRVQEGNTPADTVPKMLFNSDIRGDLCDLILELVKHDRERFRSLLVDLNSLVPYSTTDDNQVEEEVGADGHPFDFSREDAVRDPARYAGLRNLKNTCYINSLFTQLFMNTHFRRFIMSIPLQTPTGSQALLHETQKIFVSMQGGYSRSLDTAPLVRSIMSYDEEPINIREQMDVQEFQSMLFNQLDRECPTDFERARLKSFFGGDLIQQIKSTQCAHASERREPFSAISCDIKGKMSLEESLHAYVDGVLLEGENRWRCSDCNVQRDAVKRSCFKEIPDHLVFHLKRFEYNVATQQRSKIDDYFSFPLTIDMRPYTIEHLSNSQDGDVEDMFELVGILVHAGTAESGHYFSYIKERPSPSPEPKWLEFNDEKVSAWDPALMEAITFGGPQERAMRDKTFGDFPQKSHSAYMLFYQRVSSIREEERVLNLSNAAGPVQVNIPESIEAQVANESITLLTRHCLFDPTHAGFVQECLMHALGPFGDDSNSSDEQMRLGDYRSTRSEAMKMALSNLDQVISRARDCPNLEALFTVIQQAVTEHPSMALAVYNFFRQRPSALRAMLQRNSNPWIRQSARLLINLALGTLSRSLRSFPTLYHRPYVPTASEEHRETILEGAMVIFDRLWQSCYRLPASSWSEVFGVLLDFANLGDREVRHLLAHEYLSRAMGVVIEDHQSMPIQDSLRESGYTPLLTLINHLMQYLHPAIGPQSIDESPSERVSTNRAPFAWSVREVQAISASPTDPPSSFFVEGILRIEQVSEVTTAIVSRLVSTGEMMEIRVANTILNNLRGPETEHPVDPFFSAAARYIETAQSVDEAMRIVRHVSHQAPFLQHTEGAAFLSFFAAALRPRREDGGMAQAIREASLCTVPRWAPHLLISVDGELRAQVVELLSYELFSLLRNETERPLPGTPRIDAENLVLSLGQMCLILLRQVFIGRGAQIQRGQLETIKSVIEQCYSREPSGAHSWEQWSQGLVLQCEIMDSMEDLTVDDSGEE